jgi:hypothetical protein
MSVSGPGKSKPSYGVLKTRLASLNTTPARKAAARRRKLTGQAPTPSTTPASTTKTFGAAIAAYAQSRGLPLDARPARAVDRLNIRRLRRLDDMLGSRPLAALGEDDLRAMAERIYPTNPAATKNREILGPAHAVLHYAAASGWIAKRMGTLFPVETGTGSSGRD